jgi:hypothetical protein
MQGNYILTKETYIDIITDRDSFGAVFPKGTILYLDGESTGWVYNMGSHGSVWLESLNCYYVFEEMIANGTAVPWGVP